MNDQAAKLARWLLGGHGAVRNVAALLVDAFGPTGAVVATVGRTSIVAHPTAEDLAPADPAWTPDGEGGWRHPLHSSLLPVSADAAHHVLGGVARDGGLVLVNVAALTHLGVDGDASTVTAVLRSWTMQLLAKTPGARLAVTDPALTFPGAQRLARHEGETPAGTTAVLGARPPATRATPVVSADPDAAEALRCEGPTAVLTVGERRWPLWRRAEMAEAVWTPLTSTLGDATAADGPGHPHEEPVG